MNTTENPICMLATGLTLCAASPGCADPLHGRAQDRDRHSTQIRDYDRHGYRDHERRHAALIKRTCMASRTYVIERPVYYRVPAPAAHPGPGAILGAAIGSIIDSRQ